MDKELVAAVETIVFSYHNDASHRTRRPPSVPDDADKLLEQQLSSLNLIVAVCSGRLSVPRYDN